MYILGITGGIGSGKSLVMNMLNNEYDAKVLLADEIGHLSMEKGCSTYYQMVEAFGEEILDENGNILRPVLGKILMSSPDKLRIQNSIVHPFVIGYIKEKIQEYREMGIKLMAIESAILFDAGCEDLCDGVWLVTTPVEIRIQRLIKDRGYTRERAESFIKRQKNDEVYADRCDKIIINDAGIDELRSKLAECMKEILE